MLAKLWKKVLLAVCIIACIFNIMSKLVNRHSLKENLESANDGKTIFSIFEKEKVVESESELIIEGVMNPEPKEEVSNETTNTTIVVENKTNTENISQEVEVTETVENDQTESNTSNENDDNVFKFSDFQILFKKNT